MVHREVPQPDAKDANEMIPHDPITLVSQGQEEELVIDDGFQEVKRKKGKMPQQTAVIKPQTAAIRTVLGKVAATTAVIHNTTAVISPADTSSSSFGPSLQKKRSGPTLRI